MGKKKTNVRILNTANSRRYLMSKVKRTRAEFLGQVMRKRKLEHLDNRKKRRENRMRLSEN